MEEQKIETEVKGNPCLSDIPDDIMDVFVTSLLDEIMEMCESE